MGVLEIFSPKAVNAILHKLSKESVLKVVGAVTNLLGALLLWLTAASMPEHSRTSFVTIFAAAFGVVCVLKGLGFLLMPGAMSSRSSSFLFQRRLAVSKNPELDPFDVSVKNPSSWAISRLIQSVGQSSVRALLNNFRSAVLIAYSVGPAKPFAIPQPLFWTSQPPVRRISLRTVSLDLWSSQVTTLVSNVARSSRSTMPRIWPENPIATTSSLFTLAVCIAARIAANVARFRTLGLRSARWPSLTA